MTREEKQKAIDALKISAPVMAMTQEEFNNYIQIINQIMGWLEQEPCENAISRQAAIKLFLGKVHDEYPMLSDVMIGILESLPPVTPKQRTGHWQEANDDDRDRISGVCSACGWESHLYEADVAGMPFCPSCGAKMEERA